MASEARILKAIAAAEAAGDKEAVADLRSRLPAGDSYLKPPSTYDRIAGGASAFGQGFTLGGMDELTGGLVAGINKMRGDPRSLPKLYREARDASRGLNDEFSEENPKTALALNLAGGVAGPARAIGRGAKTWGDLGTAGAKAGALAGYGGSESESLSGQALDTGVGSLMGAGLGVAIPYGAQQATNAARAAGRGIKGVLASPGATATATQQTGPTLGQQAGAAYGALPQNLPLAGGERGRLVGRAGDLGMNLTYGDRTGNAAIRQMEAGLKSNPLLSAPFNEARDANTAVLNQRFAKALGLGDDVKELPPAMFGKINNTLGESFKSFGKKINKVNIPSELSDRVQLIKKTDPFLEFSDDLTELTGGEVMSLRSGLNKTLSKAWTDGDENKGKYIAKVINDIDGIIDAVIKPGDRALFRDTQKKWRLFTAIQRGKAVSDLGNVNPTSMDTALNKSYKHDYRFDKVQDPVLRDAFDANRVAHMGRDIVGDSGTATRQHWLSQLSNPVDFALTLASKPFVSSYVNNGGALSAGLLMPPEAAARGAGILTRAAETDRETRKRR